MKSQIILALAALTILIGGCKTQAPLDRSAAPQPGPAPEIEVGDYEKFTLDNGLTVIVVENHKLPRVAYQLYVDRDPIVEGERAGYVSMVGDLLRAGTTNRNKSEIDEEVDFIGATLSTSANGMYAASLKKHNSKLLELMSDVLLNPTFPEEELEKTRTQMISSIESEKNDPTAISSNVTYALRYGLDHPYGEQMKEETVKNVTVQDVRNYYTTYFKPNISYLVIVGDITTEEARPLAERYFGSWQRGEVPQHEYETPQPPATPVVALVDRPGAVQSVITVTYPVQLQPGSEDAIKASVMNNILGGGVFTGRLMQNLREDKAYTYGARSSLASDDLVGYFSAGASVRNEVTDSAVHEFLYEMERMRTEPVDTADLQLVKNSMNGSFARSLASPQTIARFALNTELYDLDDDYYETYLKKLADVDVEDVQDMAQKYILPNNTYIIVVGNKDDVADGLARFSGSGAVSYFNIYGEPVEATSITAVPEGVTAETVIQKYITALGGKEKLQNVKDMRVEMTGEIPGMGAVDMIITQKRPNKFKMQMNMSGMTVVEQVFNGQKGYFSQMGQKQEMDAEMLEEMKATSALFNELNYTTSDYSLELLGIENVEGTDAYKVVITNPLGDKTTEYFSVDTGLKIREVQTQETPQGPITQVIDYSDYTTSSYGIKVPGKMSMPMGPQEILFNLKDVKVNSSVADSEFKVQ